MTEYYLANIPVKYYDYFEKLYDNIKPVKIAVDIMVENIVGNGYSFEYTGEANKETEENKQTLKLLEDVSDKLNLNRISRIGIKDMLVLGNSFIEVVFDKDIPSELKRHDPRTVGIVTEGKGKPAVAYAKMESGQIVKCFIKENIMHFKNNLPPLGSGWYGRSQIENLLPKLMEKFKLEAIPYT